MNQEEQKISFTRNDTVMVKGIAILLLLVHHMGAVNPGIPLGLQGVSFSTVLEHLGKVCVALFTVLSGYGISEGSKRHEKKLSYVLKHVKKVLFGFGGMYLLTLVLYIVQGILPAQIYGSGFSGVFYGIKDFLGLQNFLVVTPTLSGIYWYIECIFVCYLLFPILNILFDKLKKYDFLLLAVSFLPWVYYMVKQDYGMHTDRECFYIFSFCIGIYLSRHQILNRLKEVSKKVWAVAAVSAGVAAMGILRLNLCLPADGFFAVSIICFCICTINRIPDTFVGRIITAFGKCEFELYLLHPVIFMLLAEVPFINEGSRRICLILFSMCGAYSWKQLKDKNFLLSGRKKNRKEKVDNE